MVKGWTLLVEKLKALGVKGKVKERGKKLEETGQRVFACNELSFAKVARRRKTVANTVWVDVGDCVSKETLGILKHYLVGRWKDLPNSFPLASDVEAWARTLWRLKSNLMVYQLGKDLLFMEFASPDEAKWVFEAERRWFRVVICASELVES